MNIKTLLCLTLSVVSADITVANTYVYAEQQELWQGIPTTVVDYATGQREVSEALPTSVMTAPNASIALEAPPVNQAAAQASLTPNPAESTSAAQPPVTKVPVESPTTKTGTPTSSNRAIVAPNLVSDNAATAKAKHRSKKDIDADEFDPVLPDESETSPSAEKKLALAGSATYFDVSARFGERLHRLTKSALEQNPEYQKTAKAVDHYRTNVQRALRVTKDAVNYVYPYRGFSMSMEGSRVLLDEKQKLNNLFIAELTKQRYWDEMHPKVMAQIMQIAQGLGMEKSEQANAAVQKGIDGLKNLTDAETAEATLKELSEWSNQLSIPDPVFQKPAWDVESTERVYQKALKVSGDGDPLIHQVFKTVKKYEHGKVANMAAGAIEANLSAVTILSGNPFASLAAEGASTAFVMTTGGPEENKILKELYFGRRLEIRRKRISDETQMALTNYQKALLTHNVPQLAMSEIVLSELVGPEKIAMVLEREAINDNSIAAPIELAKKDR